MTATPRTLYRKANVSKAEATASLFKRFPSMDLVSFVKKEATAEEAKAARASEGDVVYAATIRVAEFPPEGGEEESEEAPKEDAPAEKSEDKPSESDDSGGESGSEPDGFGGKDEEGGPEGMHPKKLSPDEQIIHLLQQLVDIVKHGDKLGGPDAGLDGPDGPGEPGLDLPDIGAPEQGDGLPAPGGMGGKPPLPPPVKEKSPIGAGAFAHVAKQAEVTMVREDANEINNKTIIAEASTYVPTHRVAKIQRTGLARVGDDVIDLAEARLALVTLVSR